jgi:hypothetical protein
VTQPTEPLLMEAPFLSSFRVTHPSANPVLMPESFTSHYSHVQPPAQAATDQAKAAVASFRPGLQQRETSQASLAPSFSPHISMAVAAGSMAAAAAASSSFLSQHWQRETSQTSAAVSVSPQTSAAAAAAGSFRNSQTNSNSVTLGAAARAKASYGVDAASLYISGNKGFASESGQSTKLLSSGGMNETAAGAESAFSQAFTATSTSYQVIVNHSSSSCSAAVHSDLIY